MEANNTQPEVKTTEKVHGKYDVWDWIVTKSGEVRQINSDDMMDLKYEDIERHAKIEEMPVKEAMRRIYAISDKVAGVEEARLILDKYDSLPNTNSTYSQYTTLKAIQDAINSAHQQQNQLLNEVKRLCLKLYFSPNIEVDFTTQEEVEKWVEENFNNQPK